MHLCFMRGENRNNRSAQLVFGMKYFELSGIRRTPLPVVTYTHRSRATRTSEEGGPHTGAKVASLVGPSADPHIPVPAIRTVSPLSGSIANSAHICLTYTIRGRDGVTQIDRNPISFTDGSTTLRNAPARRLKISAQVPITKYTTNRPA